MDMERRMPAGALVHFYKTNCHYRRRLKTFVRHLLELQAGIFTVLTL